VIDLNGFGQGTGDLVTTRFPLNPNIGINGVVPALAEGTSNLDAGGAGVFTLVRDTSGNSRLLRDPIVGDITDIHIGAPLDLVFNNENINVNATRANQVNPIGALPMIGNTITQPPHPNPPRLKFPPPNPNRAIFGEEPTTTSSTGPATNILTGGQPAGCINSPLNLLVQGNPFSNQPGATGIYGTLFTGTYVGPQPPPLSPPPPPPFCPFSSRQQVGHFLYVLDRDNRQIVVLNSNRFTILDTIQLSDPISMTMSPNMTRLAVSNFSSSSVSFIDIDPTSNTFHQVVNETRVERGPTAIAWQPDGEDVLVVSTDANFMSIISALDFTVRRSVSGFLTSPIDIIVTERYQITGNASGVYYAYILNSNGTVAIYESGPDGVNGIGFNDVIGTVANANFVRARAMFYDFVIQQGGVLIGHVDDNGLGQVSRLALTSTPIGQLPLNPTTGGFILPPTYRQKEWTVVQRFGGLTASTPVRDLLSGNSIVDLATDDLVNTGGGFGQATPFNLAFLRTPYLHSGKHTLKVIGGAPSFAVVPRFMFVALSDVGKVDVLEIETGRKVVTIDVPGVRVVASYWRQ
jgi:DNA-binding beta-propeller fold protein YncE